MGRAIVRSPKAFLFDEPLSNLDAALRTELRVELGALVRKFGTTSVYVTHDQIEAMTLGDRIAVMRDGELQQIGPPRAIYEDPATRFVASFLGTPPCNLFELEREDGRLRAGAVDLPVPKELGDAKRVTVGIRPEHLSLAGGEGMVTIPADVVAAEPLGAETHLYLDAAGVRLRARAAGSDAPARGDTATLFLEAKRVLFFDAASGARIRTATPEMG